MKTRNNMIAMFVLMAIFDPNHFFYWSFVDLATKLRNALDRDMIFVQMLDYNYKFINKNDPPAPYREIGMEELRSHPDLMGEFLKCAYQEVNRGYQDTLTRVAVLLDIKK